MPKVKKNSLKNQLFLTGWRRMELVWFILLLLYISDYRYSFPPFFSREATLSYAIYVRCRQNWRDENVLDVISDRDLITFCEDSINYSLALFFLLPFFIITEIMIYNSLCLFAYQVIFFIFRYNFKTLLPKELLVLVITIYFLHPQNKIAYIKI